MVMIYCASLMQTLNFSIPTSYKSSHAWTNRFQNGKMWRVQRGKKSTVSESANMSLTADMNCRVSVGISSCKQPNRVSNRIEEIPEQQERKNHNQNRNPRLHKSMVLFVQTLLWRLPGYCYHSVSIHTLKAKFVELRGEVLDGDLVWTAQTQEFHTL